MSERAGSSEALVHDTITNIVSHQIRISATARNSSAGNVGCASRRSDDVSNDAFSATNSASNINKSRAVGNYGGSLEHVLELAVLDASVRVGIGVRHASGFASSASTSSVRADVAEELQARGRNSGGRSSNVENLTVEGQELEGKCALSVEGEEVAGAADVTNRVCAIVDLAAGLGSGNGGASVAGEVVSGIASVAS